MPKANPGGHGGASIESRNKALSPRVGKRDHERHEGHGRGARHKGRRSRRY